MRQPRHLLAVLALLLCSAPLPLRAEVVLVVDTSAPDIPAAVRAEATRMLEAELAAHGLKTATPADDPAAAAKKKIAELVAKADQLAQQFKGDEALALLEEATVLFRRVAKDLRSPAPLADVLLLRAQIAEDAGERDTADDALHRLAVLDPERALDPGRFPPPVVKRYLRIRSDVAKRRGKLRVLSAPMKLPVWIDGVRRGDAPLTIDLPDGDHLIAVGPPGRTVGQLVTVREGDSTEATLRASEPDDNALRALGRAAAAERVAAGGLTLREGRYRLGLRILPARTIAESKALRSTPFAAADLRKTIKELVAKALPALGVATAAPPPPPAPAKSSSIWRKWWLWTAVGAAVAAAGGVTTAVLLTRERGVRLQVVP